MRTTEAIRTEKHIALIVAKQNSFPKKNTEKAVLHYSLGNGLYFTLAGGTVTQELIDRVKQRMQEIVAENIPIMKRSVHVSDAVSLFHRHHMYDKEKQKHKNYLNQQFYYSLPVHDP